MPHARRSALSETLPVVTLRGELTYRHPLLFHRTVEKPRERIPPGSIVELRTAEGGFIGRGFWNAQAPYVLRLLTEHENEAIDAAFFRRRIAEAVRLRREVLRLDEVSNAWRVVHAEGDGLSGLIVDRYDRVLVVVFHAAGMWRHQHWVFDALLEAFPGCQIVALADEHAAEQEGFEVPAARALAPVWVSEHGARFLVAVGGKHKTGFFCDQRDNRRRFGEFVAAMGAKSVLDLCANSGGFTVYAGRAGAGELTALELDQEAITLAERNLRENGLKARLVRADLFPWLREAIAAGKRWDAVVLDPPKLTRSREELDRALKKYLDMNRLALSVVAPGGLYLTCSCTGLVSEEAFLDMLRRAAFQAGRTVQVLEVRGAGPDHPWLAHVAESRYLKAVFARVF
ncbi:MAG: class I SAM-dependent rRNA methyltransferase [Casimicrobiaceae bacterium]|nr:class I SAM-dependent rRNA methyltransferase [Casimicrobiaceae bacterium]